MHSRGRFPVAVILFDEIASNGPVCVCSLSVSGCVLWIIKEMDELWNEYIAIFSLHWATKLSVITELPAWVQIIEIQLFFLTIFTLVVALQCKLNYFVFLSSELKVGSKMTLLSLSEYKMIRHCSRQAYFKHFKTYTSLICMSDYVYHRWVRASVKVILSAPWSMSKCKLEWKLYTDWFKLNVDVQEMRTVFCCRVKKCIIIIFYSYYDWAMRSDFKCFNNAPAVKSVKHLILFFVCFPSGKCCQ